MEWAAEVAGTGPAEAAPAFAVGNEGGRGMVTQFAGADFRKIDADNLLGLLYQCLHRQVECGDEDRVRVGLHKSAQGYHEQIQKTKSEQIALAGSAEAGGKGDGQMAVDDGGRRRRHGRRKRNPHSGSHARGTIR